MGKSLQWRFGGGGNDDKASLATSSTNYPFDKISLCRVHAKGEDTRPSSSSSHLAATASGTRLHSLSLADLHGGFVVNGGCAHALLDLPGHGQESLLDVGCVLG